MDIDSFPGQLARTQRFTLGAPRSFALSPDGTRLLFLRTHGPESRAGCLWLLDRGEERLLADPDVLAAASAGGAGTMPEAELVRRERARERTTGIVAYSVGVLGYVIGLALSAVLDLPSGALIVWTLAACGIGARLVFAQEATVAPVASALEALFLDLTQAKAIR